MKKPTLCVIFGGKSSEYEVSLRSAYAVLCHLSKEKYDLVRLGITKGGEWYIFEGENEKILTDTWQGDGCAPVTVDLSNGHLIVLEKDVYAIHIDLFLPILHGGYGEDGRLQGLFDIAGGKYVGCSSFVSHICMDKRLTKMLASSLGVPVARDLCNAKFKMQNAKFTSYLSHTNLPMAVTLSLEWEDAECGARDEEWGKNFTYPVFVKPAMGGSSVGVTKVERREELDNAVSLALEYGDVLIEEEIDGDEVEIGVLELSGKIAVSPVGMIRHGGEFYDYETKYLCGENEYLIPAPIDEKTTEVIREYARRLFIGLGCEGFGRFDFFVKKNGEVVFNEVNTLPGFTDISMFPKLFMSMGYSFEELLDAIIENAE